MNCKWLCDGVFVRKRLEGHRRGFQPRTVFISFFSNVLFFSEVPECHLGSHHDPLDQHHLICVGDGEFL